MDETKKQFIENIKDEYWQDHLKERKKERKKIIFNDISKKELKMKQLLKQ